MTLQIVTAHKQLEGGGFEVTRPIPSMGLPILDPFLLLDQMGPADVGPGEAKGAPDHPHRGFETVTYMFSGEMEHRDSHGNHGVIRAGDVQWMTAGAGVIHSEMPSEQFQSTGGRMHGLQLWVNLPAKLKMTSPRYQDIAANAIPEVELPGGKVRVLAGNYGGQSAVIDTHTPITYLHFSLQGGASAPVQKPADHNGFLYVVAGDIVVEGQSAHAGQLVVLPENEVAVVAGSSAEIVAITGKPLGEPIARWGPFVMNTKAEIQAAIDDYQNGRFGEIPASTTKPYLPGRDPPASS